MEREHGQELMTPGEVAALLHINPASVYRLIRRKELAASRIGRSYRIPRPDLDAFLIAQSSRPQVRQALFERALDFARRVNPDGDSDEVLAELERLDAERVRQRSSA